ncbi:MAG: hypothetical protein IR164_06410 [Devosia sp.]|uniref:hypothetical protein n=1 Tax=Devosia sp. TaxID=1871048 RepID=UPI0019FC7E53|nr:hypothetical protein [Devosia sp.]MBF0678552.1 hypothetical protein [Devosia sp.]
MAKQTPIRHPSLSSKAARNALDHLTTPIYDNVFSTIDSLGSLYDGLAAVRANEDPTKTRENNALAYQQKFEAAYLRAQKLANERAEAVAAYEAKIVADAYKKAGVDKLPTQAEAIWLALRGMDQKSRDAAVIEAINSGDRVVIAAITHAPSPMLTGKFTVPVKTSTELFIDKMAPEMRQELGHIERAMAFLEHASSAFVKSAQELRDLPAEQRGAEGHAAATQAESAFQAAMQG